MLVSFFSSPSFFGLDGSTLGPVGAERSSSSLELLLDSSRRNLPLRGLLLLESLLVELRLIQSSISFTISSTLLDDDDKELEINSLDFGEDFLLRVMLSSVVFARSARRKLS